MNTDTHAAHADDHHHGDSHANAHGSFSTYMLGFVLSVVLTAIPFWLVMSGALPSKQITALVIMAFAVVQIVVHMIYFLHMNAKVEQGWAHERKDVQPQILESRFGFGATRQLISLRQAWRNPGYGALAFDNRCIASATNAAHGRTLYCPLV